MLQQLLLSQCISAKIANKERMLFCGDKHIKSVKLRSNKKSMKKIIRKFWGIGLIVVLLSTLLVGALPVSAADPLNWEPKTDAPAAIPFAVLPPGTDVVDY